MNKITQVMIINSSGIYTAVVWRGNIPGNPKLYYNPTYRWVRKMARLAEKLAVKKNAAFMTLGISLHYYLPQ